MLFILFYLLLPSYHTHTYPPDVYRILFGNLTLEDLYLPETTEIMTEAEMKNISKLDIRELLRDSFIADHTPDVYQDLQNITVKGEDAKEYNDISTMIYNFTRKRVFSQYWGMDDYDDRWRGEYIEGKKVMMFEKICLMYLYHARYKIEIAFKLREPLMDDKRYRLGYLFNRVRRLKTEMLKFVATAERQHSFAYWFQNLTSLMRIYERVVHFDIDIRDTTALIHEVYSEDASFDKITDDADDDVGVKPPNLDRR